MEFINYVLSFYGPGGIYDMGATYEIPIDAMPADLSAFVNTLSQ
jgi:hypothetical protein